VRPRCRPARQIWKGEGVLPLPCNPSPGEFGNHRGTPSPVRSHRPDVPPPQRRAISPPRATASPRTAITAINFHHEESRNHRDSPGFPPTPRATSSISLPSPSLALARHPRDPSPFASAIRPPPGALALASPRPRESLPSASTPPEPCTRAVVFAYVDRSTSLAVRQRRRCWLPGRRSTARHLYLDGIRSS
jgi:hypothetical protein